MSATEAQSNADEIILLSGTLNDLRISHEDLDNKYKQVLEELAAMK